MGSRESLLKGGNSGPAIVPGYPERSLLIQSVQHTHERLKMPLSRSKLEEQEISDLISWVRAGAVWVSGSADTAQEGDSYSKTEDQRAFWSFQPVTRPDLPEVRDESWPRGPIDHFILSRMERQGLRPVPTADRRSLIRRASFDLTGLPPTPEEVDAFLDDLRAHGVDDNVTVLMFTEFGRRTHDNGSGTDHGAGGAAFMFGANVKGGQYSEYPSMEVNDLEQGDVVPNYDYRGLYTTVIEDWMGLDGKAVVGGTYEKLGILA